MKTTTLFRILKGVALMAAFVAGSGLRPVWAGENSVYFKSGWFTWDETVDGRSFVREQGLLYRAGFVRKDEVSVLNMSELVEVWGGNLDYDGHDITGSVPMKTDTNYLGTKEEVALGVKIGSSEGVSFEP